MDLAGRNIFSTKMQNILSRPIGKELGEDVGVIEMLHTATVASSAKKSDNKT